MKVPASGSLADVDDVGVGVGTVADFAGAVVGATGGAVVRAVGVGDDDDVGVACGEESDPQPANSSAVVVRTASRTGARFMSSSCPVRWNFWSLASCTVDGLADEIGVTVVPGVLLDHVHMHHP